MSLPELIAYVDGELSDSERAEFETQLREDSALRSQLVAFCRQRLLMAQVLSAAAAQPKPGAGRGAIAARRFFSARIALSAAAGIALAAGLIWVFSRTAQTKGAYLEALATEMSIERAGRKLDLRPALPLIKNDLIAVTNGAAVVAYGDQSRLTLSAPAEIQAQAAEEGGRAWRLNSGRLRVYANPKTGGALRVITPHATATVIGTEFELVVNNEETQLSVTSGRVRFLPVNGDEKLVAAGERANAGAPMPRLPLKLDAIADAYISKAHADANFGAEKELLVSGAIRTEESAVVKFEIPPGVPLRHATLRLHSKINGGPVSVAAVEPDWEENKISYSSRPKRLGEERAEYTPGRTAAEWEIDVTALLTKAGPAAFEISSSSPHPSRLFSRRANRGAELLLTDGEPTIDGF